MPRRKKEETPEPAETSEPKKTKSVSVINKDCKLVRVYNAKDHGKDYQKLAKQFVEKSNKKFKNKKDEKYSIK